MLIFLTLCRFFLVSLFRDTYSMCLGASTLFIQNPEISEQLGPGECQAEPGSGRSPSQTLGTLASRRLSLGA